MTEEVMLRHVLRMTDSDLPELVIRDHGVELVFASRGVEQPEE
jgi:hypothetical protein